jgi:hypothetical protein
MLNVIKEKIMQIGKQKLQRIDDGNIRNMPSKDIPGVDAAVKDVVGKLNFADVFRNGQYTIANSDYPYKKNHTRVRIDHQGSHDNGHNQGGKWHNIQIQINGISGNSTVAHVNVHDSLASIDQNVSKIAQSKIRDALLSSFKDKHSYSISLIEAK